MNNAASKKSTAPTTSANGVQLVDKNGDKGWGSNDIAITSHYLGKWWLLRRS